MDTLKGLAKNFPVLLGGSVLLAIFQILTWFNWLHNFSNYDTGVHFVFSIFISQLIYVILVDFKLVRRPRREHSRTLLNPTRIVLLIVFVGTTVGVCWEFVEFAVDHLLGAHLQKGNTDTMLDLIADTSGSLVGGLLYNFLARWRPFFK